MLYKFWVRSDEAEDFVLHVYADATNTFYQLHETLQEQCKFDPAQLVTIFLADEEWDKGTEIKMFGNSAPKQGSEEEKIMMKTRLMEFLSSEEDKLLYTFDMNNDNSLYLELFKIEAEQTIKTPTVILHKGTPPLQMTLVNCKSHLPGIKDADSQQIFDDLGELEDLYNIYGEMRSNIL